MTEKKEVDFIVGIGLSTGGEDALVKFIKSFKGVEEDFCVVIVMQTSSHDKQKILSLLKTSSKWPLLTTENNSPLQNRHIYLAPSDSTVHFKNGFLQTEYNSIELPIDSFFSSLAEEKKGKAIGIILSGPGNDGSVGVEEIKKNKGFTIAQLPNTAEDNSMPAAAIQTNNIDVVLPAEQMYQEIIHYVNNYKIIIGSSLPTKGIDAIFELLEKRSGTDFSQYKPTTILRRIDHRIKKLELNTLSEYCAVLKETPQELDNLFETVLIGVTEFFRDSTAFQTLRQNLEKLLSNKTPEDPVRIWCVGCASGEEPYSVAIMLREILGSKISNYHIQIFASDIDERVLNIARKGVYAQPALENLEPKLIAKYFDKRGLDHFEVKKAVKNDILFSKHDITNDPPFVKLDTIICRNLLIYFNSNLQKQTFQIFHFALRKNGLLFLGKSESVSVASELFTKADDFKIFRKADTSQNYRLKFSQFRNKNEVLHSDIHKQENINLSLVDVAKETLYYKYEHPFVIINEQGEIKEVNGSLRLYLEISQGAMNANLHKMVNPELATTIRILLTQVKKSNVPHSSQMIKFNLYEVDHFVKIKIIPLVYAINEAQFYIIIFEKIDKSENYLLKQGTFENASGQHVQELEEELSTLREHLQIFTEELEASNEELQIINEELQSTNEELKSTNEELETSNEELESSNEELNSTNRELSLNVDALKQKESDLKKAKKSSEKNEIIYRTISENIPNGSIGILNEDLEIEYLGGKELQLYTSTAETLKGKPFSSILKLSENEGQNLTSVISKTIDGTSANTEFYFKNSYYNFSSVNIKLPTDSGRKVLFLIQNITQAKKDNLKVMMAIEAANLIIYEYNFKTKSFHLNEAFLQFFELEESELGDNNAVLNKFHPEDLAHRNKKIEESLQTGWLSYEARVLLKAGTRYIRVFGRVFFDDQNNPELEVSTLIDVTKDKMLLQQVNESKERFKLIADSAPVMIWMSNEDKSGTYYNKLWRDFIGNSEGNEPRLSRLEMLHPDDLKGFKTIFENSYAERVPYVLEYRLKRGDGKFRWVRDHAVPIIDSNDQFEGFVGSAIDITEQKKFTQELERQVYDRTVELQKSNDELIHLNISLEEYAHVASHDLQEPLRKISTFISILKTNTEDPASVEKYIDKINLLANQMRDLIRNILDYSRLSESTLAMVDVNLDEQVKDIEDELELMINEKGAKIKYNKLGSLKANEVHIRQLLTNLIKNALKYNNNKPRIEINAGKVKKAEIPGYFSPTVDLYRKVTISDNGIGIDPQHKDIIFKPFKRLHSKTEYGGTGIGLSICRRIIEIHQGFIDLESEKGQGSTFIIYMPIQEN